MESEIKTPGDLLEVLRWVTGQLEKVSDNPRVEAEWVLGTVTGLGRAQLFAAVGSVRLSSTQLERIQSIVERRRASEPLQYLLGTQPFRSLNFLVGPGVLVPRPETELLVDVALKKIQTLPEPLVIDLGTGSGAIALSIAHEHPGANVFATDIDPQALDYARRNLEISTAKSVEILQGDLFEPVEPSFMGKVDLVVTNPPYLSFDEIMTAAPDVRDHEPRLATTSEPSGAEVSQRIIEEAIRWLQPGGWLVMETSPTQVGTIRPLMESNYREVSVLRDLAGSERIVEGRRV